MAASGSASGLVEVIEGSAGYSTTTQFTDTDYVGTSTTILVAASGTVSGVVEVVEAEAGYSTTTQFTNTDTLE